MWQERITSTWAPRLAAPPRVLPLYSRHSLALTPGTRLGVYDIAAPIGEGGMGQVYRATDTTLGRQVAIKILPDAFAQDPERLGRFEREAKTLASLNHPHIAAIYGFEKSAGMHALVMELVEGQDLSQRIAGSAIPIEEALPIARQIAEALEAAHEQGIVHRDLKPANVKLRADGTVKVLDFGLARPGETGASGVEALNSPTFTSPAALTVGGVILGTAAYMAPEQARGKTIDKRADIWAFGLVLYEMLTGRTAFAGDTITDILAAVLTHEPDWTAVPATTPASIRRLLQRCLEKDPKRRLRDIGDARLEIEETILSSAVYAPPGYLVFARNGMLTALPFDLAAGRVTGSPVPIGGAVATESQFYFAGISASADGTLAVRPPPALTLSSPGMNTAETELHLVDRTGTGSRVSSRRLFSFTMALSPVDSRVAAAAILDPRGGTSDLWLMDLTKDTAVPLTTTRGFASYPVWSADGKRMAYAYQPSGGMDAQESGRPEVYVTTFPERRQTWPLTTDGGQAVGWRKDGREILVATLSGHIAAYPVTTEGGFSHGEPTTLVRNLGSLAAYTIATPDHSRMIIRVSPDAAQDKGEMRLLFGWQDGVRQRNP